jgi:hypothetical protein
MTTSVWARNCQLPWYECSYSSNLSYVDGTWTSWNVASKRVLGGVIEGIAITYRRLGPIWLH